MIEIKELYSEELALLKQIQSYGKGHPHGKLERVEKVMLLLLYRIYSNLYSSLLLTVQVLKTGKISFFQFSRLVCCCVVAIPTVCSLYTFSVLTGNGFTRSWI